MENWNHSEVVALASRWQEAGLGDTSSGRFLRSLADTATPPRGRGIDWLVGLIKQGDPGPSVALGREIEKLIPLAGGNASSLEKMALDLKSGRPLPSWGYDLLSRVRSGISAGNLPKEITQEERDLLSNLSLYKSGQSSFYWSKRPGTSNKLDKIFSMARDGKPLTADDIEYVRSNFKSVVKQIENPDYPPGSIAAVNGSNVIFDGRHNNKNPAIITCLILSSPFVSSVMRQVTVKVIVGAEVGEVCVRNLVRI